MIRSQLGHSASRIRLKAGTSHAYSSQQTTSTSSKHSGWYKDIVPGMIPIALLGSSVYLVRTPNLAAVLLMEPTAKFVHRDYSLRARNCRARNRWSKPRSVSPILRPVSSNSNHRLGTCPSKGTRDLPRNLGGGEDKPKMW